MEKESVFSHYCDDERNELFTAFSLKDRTSRRYDVPYSTVFLFDSAQISNQIYFTGGGLPESDTEEQTFFATAVRVTIHSTLETTNEKLPNMLVARASHTLVALANKEIYAIGGCNSTGDLKLCEAFDILKNKWKKCPSLTENKIWVSVCSFNNRYLYAFGGGASQDSETNSNVIEFYDTTLSDAKQWSRVTLNKGKEFFQRCIFVGVMQVSPENILIFGGHVDKDASCDSFLFSPSTRQFTECGKLAKRDEFYRTKPEILGNELMIVGSAQSDLHIYNTVSKMWTIVYKSAWNPDVVLSLKAETY